MRPTMDTQAALASTLNLKLTHELQSAGTEYGGGDPAVRTRAVTAGPPRNDKSEHLRRDNDEQQTKASQEVPAQQR
jgi:hypothetical protein